MKKYFILVNFLFVFFSSCFAQNNYFESETIFLHTNETTFVTGENLLYKVYCLNANSKELSKTSKIAYIEIIDSNNKIMSRQKIALNNGIASNEIFIGTNFNSGNYKLIAYTNWMLNNSKSKYFESNLIIINPFSPLKNEVNGSSKNYLDGVSEKSNFKNYDVTLELSKKIYDKRNKVELNIIANSQKFKDGNFSISVRKIDNLRFIKPLSSTDFINKDLDKFINQNNVTTLPELRGELFSGKISSNDVDKKISEKYICLSIIGEPFEFKIVKTNTNGEFYFILDKEINKSDCLIQILENDIKDYQITFDKLKQPEFNSNNFENNLKIDESYIEDIESRLIACQIVNAYENKDTITLQKSKFKPFYSNESKEYILDDYKRFPTFKETIIEIVPAVYFKNNDNNYTLHVRDYITNGESFGSALVLVDGLFLQDVNELFNYNTNNIYKIDVVNKAYSYGSRIFSGIISITTFNREYNPKSKNIFKTQLERCISDYDYIPFNYDLDKDYKRLPDYRYQLVWESKLSLTDKNNPFYFYTSDIEGKFEISMEGFSSKGEPLSLKTYFEVKWKFYQ